MPWDAFLMSNATIIIALSTITTGIMLGAIFSLVAVGVTIVYGSIWMPNAANGQFFLLAALVSDFIERRMKF